MKYVGSGDPAMGLTFVRVIVGLVFVVHGAQKMFMFGPSGVAGAMAQMGIPAPALSAWIVMLLEFFGGLALMAGLLTRVVSALFAFQMLVAVIAVHLKAGFFLPAGYEYALTLMVASIGLAVGGPGALALDNTIFGRSTVRTRERMAA